MRWVGGGIRSQGSRCRDGAESGNKREKWGPGGQRQTQGYSTPTEELRPFSQAHPGPRPRRARHWRLGWPEPAGARAKPGSVRVLEGRVGVGERVGAAPLDPAAGGVRDQAKVPFSEHMPTGEPKVKMAQLLSNEQEEGLEGPQVTVTVVTELLSWAVVRRASASKRIVEDGVVEGVEEIHLEVQGT